jgi:hypothetical protein
VVLPLTSSFARITIFAPRHNFLDPGSDTAAGIDVIRTALRAPG